jgi:hypothetical protein
MKICGAHAVTASDGFVLNLLRWETIETIGIVPKNETFV